MDLDAVMQSQGLVAIADQRCEGCWPRSPMDPSSVRSHHAQIHPSGHSTIAGSMKKLYYCFHGFISPLQKQLLKFPFLYNFESLTKPSIAGQLLYQLIKRTVRITQLPLPSTL